MDIGFFLNLFFNKTKKIILLKCQSLWLFELSGDAFQIAYFFVSNIEKNWVSFLRHIFKLPLSLSLTVCNLLRIHSLIQVEIHVIICRKKNCLPDYLRIKWEREQERFRERLRVREW